MSVCLTLRLTVSRPVCLGIKRIRLTVTFLIPWGALSDERTGLSFVCAAGPCQRSLFRVLVPWDLRPYFTVSDLRVCPLICCADLLLSSTVGRTKIHLLEGFRFPCYLALLRISTIRLPRNCQQLKLYCVYQTLVNEVVA
jgi:hypothetical protein